MAARRSRKKGPKADRRPVKQAAAKGMSKEVFQRDTPIMKELSWLCPDASLDENKGCATSRDGVTDLNLSGWGMASLPDTIGGLAALRNIDLTNCSSLTALPNTIGELGALRTLKLEGCESLVALPAAISELKSLKVLDLSRCPITALPDAIGGLTALNQIYLDRCSSLATLPDAIGKLGALTELNLLQCSKLAALPDPIGELGALTSLDLSGCSSLAKLPAAIGELGALTTLDLSYCESLAELPDAVGKLGALTTLDVTGCSITKLPVAIISIPNVTIEGWDSSDLEKTNAFVLFAKLARPRVKAAFQDVTIGVIGEIISHFWSQVSKSRRAKVDDTHDGIAYGQFLVSTLIRQVKNERRRTCDACDRCGDFEEDRFPVCWCGARRYCGEECQKADWAAGHAQTCASGHTWSGKDLLWFRSLEKQRAEAERNLEYLRSLNQGQPGFIQNVDRYLTKNEQMRQELIARNPPPADRER